VLAQYAKWTKIILNKTEMSNAAAAAADDDDDNEWKAKDQSYCLQQ